ncbi:MAG: hypothetical protein K2M03_03540 [Muribaculaceae bacterium]|nr:hypothetical protein [Muribaculaceae bacterium]
MEKHENKLWPADMELFAAMKTKSISPEEFNFFQNIEFKQLHESTLSNDLIMSENDNAEGIYIVREEYDEYVVGCILHPEDEVHVMNLSEALNIDLSQIGIKGNDETIWEWLRSINYQGISYNHNYDNI